MNLNWKHYNEYISLTMYQPRIYVYFYGKVILLLQWYNLSMCRLKPSANQLFVQRLAQKSNKNIKASHYCPVFNPLMYIFYEKKLVLNMPSSKSSDSMFSQWEIEVHAVCILHPSRIMMASGATQRLIYISVIAAQISAAEQWCCW